MKNWGNLFGRTRLEDLIEKTEPDPAEHTHFHEHDGDRHAHSHRHTDSGAAHAHSTLTRQVDMPAKTPREEARR